MNAITHSSGIITQSSLLIERIAEDLSQGWHAAPFQATLPVIFFTGDNPLLFNQIKDHIKGVEIRSNLIEINTGRDEKDTLSVIDKLIKIAANHNLPAIIEVEPNLYGKIQKPPQALSIVFGEAHPDFDLVLDNRIDAASLALFFLDAKLSNMYCLPLEQLVIRDTRNHLGLKTSPAPRHILSGPILELLPAYVEKTLAKLEKIHPAWHQVLVKRFPQKEEKEQFIKNILIDSIEKSPTWLRSAKPQSRTDIENEYLQFNLERKKIRATEFSSPIILSATPVCTGRAQFILSVGPEEPIQLSNLWELAQKKQSELIVSLTEENETLELFPYSDGKISTELSSSKSQGAICLNTIALESSGETKEFTQLHYKKWIDNEVIPAKELHSCILSANANRKPDQPIFVHCKQGLGRSGIFCACFELYLRSDPNPDIRSLVMEMNLQRFNMIYLPEQYQAIFDYAAYLNTIIKI